MANFEIAYQLTAGHEGGYQNHPNDTGNYNSAGQNVGTNWGINAQVYEAHIGHPPTEADMRSMSRSVAKQIYRAKYWDSIRGDQIADQQLANIWYDGRVNHGYTGTKLMQRVLNVPDDGHVGPVTLGAVNATDPRPTFYAYRQKRIDFYHYLANNRPGLSVFLTGWLRRINSFEYGSPSSHPVATLPGSNGSTSPTATSGSAAAGGLAVLALAAFIIFQ